MTTKDYRPLPDELNHGCGFGTPDLPLEGYAPPEGFGPPPGMEPPPEMLEMMRQDEQRKHSRLPLAKLFQSGSATWEDLTLPYRLYVPEHLAEGKQYPLVLFLHGGGERGDDNEAQLIANDGAIVWVRDQIEGTGEACFVLAAQCPQDGPGWLEPHLLAASQALDNVIAAYPIDESRLYLTGMSMGGGGCWRMNYMFPERFAAVVPMCSACGLDKTGKEIDNNAIQAIAESFLSKPLWLFHAADDFVVTPETTRSLAKALEERGLVRGRDFFYTEYPAECGYNHGCWNPAYEWKLMRQWLFQQTTAPMPAFGPPEGMEPPPEMLEMMKREEEARNARRQWLDRFQAGLCVSPEVTVSYRLYVPENAPKGLPLVVVLHGIGGCGCDNEGQILDNDGVIDWVKAQDNGVIEPCYVFAPQCPMPTPNLKWEIEYLEVVAAEIDRIIARNGIDPCRVYLTGLSLGGFGSWNLNRLRPDLFAAVVTCCPACLVGTMMEHDIDEAGMDDCAGALVERPLWMFHSADDMGVPAEITMRMADKLRALGKQDGDDFRLTIYPEELHYNHGCWVPAYKDEEMLAWLFRHERSNVMA